MLREHVDTFGSRSWILALLIFCFCVSILGCSSKDGANLASEESVKVSSDVLMQEASNLPIQVKPENFFKIKKEHELTLNDVNEDEIKSLFTNATESPYPEGYYFMPTQLHHRKIYGQANELADGFCATLACLDLDTADFDVIKIGGPSTTNSFGVLGIRGKYLVFYEINHVDAYVTYYVYNSEISEVKEVYKINNIPSLLYSDATLVEEGVMFNILDPNSENYQNKFYSFNTGEITDIEDQNCGFPVYLNENWFYLIIDNFNQKTKLIEYYPKGKMKVVRYELQGVPFMSGIYNDGKDLFLTISNLGRTELYLIDLIENEIKYLVEIGIAENLRVCNGYLTWTGEPRFEDRVRLQYYLLDLKTLTHYKNNNGEIFLDEFGMAFVEYKKSDAEIEKYKVYTNENTCIKLIDISD